MKYDSPNTRQALYNIANTWANQMRLNLEAKVKRTTVRAKWQNGKPKNISYKSIRANHVASGALVNSIQVIEKPKTFAVDMLWYGQIIDQGREKGKGIPVDVMQEWTKQKGLKPRNTKSGQFLKNTKNNRKAMAFCMNRKIKYFGIEAYPFIEKSKEIARILHEDEINISVGKDLRVWTFRLMKKLVNQKRKIKK